MAEILEALYDPTATEPLLSDEDVSVPFEILDPVKPRLPGSVLAAMQTLGHKRSFVYAGQLQELVIPVAAAQLLQGVLSLTLPANCC